MPVVSSRPTAYCGQLRALNTCQTKPTMSQEENKRRLEAWAASQSAKVIGDCPLPDALMKVMFKAIEEAVEEHGCDHSLKATQGYLDVQSDGFDTTSVLSWFERTGGKCDCEVLRQSLPTWLKSR